jgi:hypothetical protein
MGYTEQFSTKDAISELKRCMKDAGLAKFPIDDFLVATAVLLNGRKIDLPFGVTAEISISVTSPRHTRVQGGDQSLLEGGGYMAVFHPDGPLGIFISISPPKDKKHAGVVIKILNTEVDTEMYFSRELVVYPQPQAPALDLKRDLEFSSLKKPPVSPTQL